MRDTIKLGLTLAFICSFAAVLLFYVVEKTVPMIKENERIANELKRKEVMTDAVTIEPNSTEAPEYYIAKDASGNVIGHVLSASERGYGGLIKITVGVATDGSIRAIQLTKLDQQETPGLGAKVVTAKFKDQFKGRKVADLKVMQDGGHIVSITAATITSRAATKAVRDALEGFLSKK